MPTISGLIEAHATSSARALLILGVFEHPQLTDPFYIVRNNEPLVSTVHGTSQTYLSFGMDVRLPDASDDLSRAKLVLDPLAMPTAPIPVSGEPISEGQNVLVNSQIAPSTVVIYNNGTPIGADDGRGFILGDTIDEAQSGIQYTTGALDLVLLSGSGGTLTCDYEYNSSAESIVSLLRGLSPIDGPIEVSLYLVYEDEPNTAQLTWPKMTWTDVGFVLTAVEGRLGSVVDLNAALQEKNRRFTPTNFPGLFA